MGEFRVRGAVVFSMSKANSANGTGNSPAVKKEKPMSFHRITPVKHSRKAAPAHRRTAVPVSKPGVKKAAPKPRPVGRPGC